MHNLTGKSHLFPDGSTIYVLQVKERDENQLWVSYYIQTGPGIPRKLTMLLADFLNYYGHLFGGEVSGDSSMIDDPKLDNAAVGIKTDTNTHD